MSDIDPGAQAAPFLKYHSDPYAVIVDGKVYWIQDAYTVTSRIRTRSAPIWIDYQTAAD